MKTNILEQFKSEFFKEIFHSSHLGFFYYSISGEILEANNFIIKLFNIPYEDINKHNIYKITDNKDFTEILKKAVKEGESYYIGPFKGIKKVSLKAKKVNNNKGELIGGICIISDITNEERYKSELQLSNKILTEEIAKNKKLLSEIKNTEKNYKSIFELSPTPIIVHLDGDIKLANKAALQFAGTDTFDDVIGLSAFDFLHPDDFEIAMKHIQATLNGAPPSIVEERFYTLNNELRYVLVSTATFIYNNKTAILVNFLDVTRFKEYEQKINVIFQGTDSLTAGFLIVDNSGIIEYLNAKFIHWLQLDKQNIIKTNIKDLQNHTYKEFFEKLAETIQTGKEWKGEIMLSSNKEIPLWLYCILSPVKNKKDEIINYVAVVEDISARKRTEQQLIQREQYFHTLYEDAPDGIFEINENATIINCNKEFARSVKLPKSEIIGQHAIKFIANKDIFDDYFNKFKNSEFLEVEIEQLNGDGTTRAVWRKITPLKNNDGKIKGAIVFNRDITERKKIENELIEAKNKAEEADKLKTAFLANMSHEIRTPINAINGFAYILSKENLSPEKRNIYHSYIQSNSKLLLNLINDIIDLSKIEANQITISKSDISLNNFFNDIYNTYLIQHKTTNNNVDFILDTETSNIIINSDETRLRQIVFNLINNSIKFTEKGYIKFGYKKLNNKVIIFVEDTGEGIPEEKVKSIFDRFVRIEKQGERKQGAGLGLSIVKQLSKLLEGEISIESSIGKGTRISVIFNYEETKLATKTIEKTMNNNKLKINWKNKKILIAEDDEFNFLVIQEYLSDTSAEIIRAKNGEEAVNKYSAQIDLVLMDIQMPKLNGLEATKRILKQNPKAKIIAQTAFALSNEKESSLKAGCKDYITKPIEKEEIINKISKYI